MLFEPENRRQGGNVPAPVGGNVHEVVTAAEFIGSLPKRGGFIDTFLERRFSDGRDLDVPALAERGVIAFLSKSTQVDEYYLLDRAGRELAPGQYRIRQESSTRPIITRKTHGMNGVSPSETIDNVNPHDETIEYLRAHGKLLAVIEKDRTTYKSRQLPNCLLHQDEVRGLGRFVDIKADTAEALDAFVAQVGLSSRAPIERSYRDMRAELGIDERQLAVWKFHERFKGYIVGVVSGTLTPLGFLTATVASHQSRSAALLAILSAGICDGFSDAVANSQSTQSSSRASLPEQVRTFCRTMAGKVVVPLTFVPIVLCTSSELATLAASAGWAAVLLSGTAAVQAVANERPVGPAVRNILAMGSLATAAGIGLGKAVPVIAQILGL